MTSVVGINKTMHKNYLTNFKLSRKLKLKGLPQNSDFYYNNKDKEPYYHTEIPMGLRNFHNHYTAAFFECDIDKHLPEYLGENKECILKTKQVSKKEYLVGYAWTLAAYNSTKFKPPKKYSEEKRFYIFGTADTKLNAKAFLLIKLITCNQIKIK